MSPLVGLLFTLQVIMLDKTQVSVRILDDPATGREIGKKRKAPSNDRA